MKQIFTFLLIVAATSLSAQKKITIVNQSELTGIRLPEGSKLDKRLLYESSAELLLEMQSKKDGTTINKTETLYLPLTANFSADTLTQQLTNNGWSIIPVTGDPKYIWLQKENHSVIAYFSIEKKDIQLYFGESSTPPNLSGAGTNNPPNNNNSYSDPTPPPVPAPVPGSPAA